MDEQSDSDVDDRAALLPQKDREPEKKTATAVDVEAGIQDTPFTFRTTSV